MKKIALFTVIALTIGCLKCNRTKTKKKIMKKVLFVLTSHDKLGDTGKTGYWTEEFAAPYYELADEGVQIDIATPLGGQPQSILK
jgi:putative intracellular protease/amidase